MGEETAAADNAKEVVAEKKAVDAKAKASEAADKSPASSSVDDEGRARSGSMPQHGGTATDDTKGGKSQHGEAKVNQKDVAHSAKIASAALEYANTHKGPLNEHLSGKGIDTYDKIILKEKEAVDAEKNPEKAAAKAPAAKEAAAEEKPAAKKVAAADEEKPAAKKEAAAADEEKPAAKKVVAAADEEKPAAKKVVAAADEEPAAKKVVAAADEEKP